jgi:3',5'-nucleoside bisphosphate phosphatase
MARRTMTVTTDLHTHTTVTDGRMTPFELVDAAATAGLRNLVITDHSAVTFTSVVAYAASLGVRLPFPGVEVSTFLGARRYHLLLYGDALLGEDLQDRLELPLRWKRELARRACRELARRGHRLPTVEEIAALGIELGRPTPEKRYPSRTAVARHLAEAEGLSRAAAYELVASVFHEIDARDAGDPARLARRYLPTLEVLDLAVGRGLTPSLAHPLWQCTSVDDVEAVCADVARMAEAGLRGMESRSYHHRALDDHPYLRRTRDQLGLIGTAGSDFHANGKVDLGSQGLDADDFAAVWRLVADASSRTRPDLAR